MTRKLVTATIVRSLHDELAVAEIVIDSPANRNALSRQLVRELREELRTAGDNEEVGAVLIRSSSTAFCSGADLAEAGEFGMESGARDLVALLAQIVSLPKPVVARVDGPVLAGGIGIIAACDITIADRAATYCFSEVRLGLAPAVISLTVLPQMTPRLADLAILSASPFDGPMAEASGLVTLAVDLNELDDTVTDILRELLKADRQGAAASKAILKADVRQRIDDLGVEMATWSAELFASESALAAISNFRGSRASKAAGATDNLKFPTRG